MNYITAHETPFSLDEESAVDYLLYKKEITHTEIVSIPDTLQIRSIQYRRWASWNTGARMIPVGILPSFEYNATGYVN